MQKHTYIENIQKPYLPRQIGHLQISASTSRHWHWHRQSNINIVCYTVEIGSRAKT